MVSSRKHSFAVQAFQLLDAFLVYLAFFASSGLRVVIRDVLGMPVPEESFLASTSWLLYVCVPLMPLVLDRLGFYDRMRQKRTRQAVMQLLKALVWIVLLVGVIAVFARWVDARRLILGIGLILAFVALLGRDRLTTRWLRKREADEGTKERVVVAGSGGEMDELLSELEEEVTADWHVVERFDLATRQVDELYELLKREAVVRVLFVAKHTEFEKVARAVEACELQGVEAWISASFIRSQIARPVFDAVGERPMLVLRSTPELSWELMIKGMVDKVGAGVIFLLSLPFWVFAWIGIRLTSPGAPVFFSQMRAGRYGKPFRMWKFRTMVPDADQLLHRIKAEHGNQMDGPVFKLDRDPRVFPFGALLRKLSIDELPQLLNVLRGDMSLVGPRPLPLYEVAAFSQVSHRRRLSVKPGITGEWQAGGRNRIRNFEEWVEMDLHYIDNWSLWLDFKILAKTIPAVLFGRGAK